MWEVYLIQSNEYQEDRLMVFVSYEELQALPVLGQLMLCAVVMNNNSYFYNHFIEYV